MSASPDQAEYWQALIDALNDFMDGRVGITEGCRNIVDVARALEEGNNELLVPFVAFDSETDTMPVGPIRARWAPAALLREDEERIRYEELCRTSLIKAVQRLLAYANKHAL